MTGTIVYPFKYTIDTWLNEGKAKKKRERDREREREKKELDLSNTYRW